MGSIVERLQKGSPLVLDGAMGTELESRGVPMDGEAWCGLAVRSHPQIVYETHLDYLRAGARVITTNTFGSARRLLEAASAVDHFEAINREAVALARKAAGDFAGDCDIWIAGSVSCLSPGADASRRASSAVMRANFNEQAQLLAEAGVDVIALEMMRDLDYMPLALEAAHNTGLPVWMGLSCRQLADGRVTMHPRIGENELLLGDVVDYLQDDGRTSLCAIMHSKLMYVDAALEIVQNRWHGPVGVYPHCGEFAMPHWQFSEACTPDALAQAAGNWVARGVKVAGGCCGFGPQHIAAVSTRLASFAGADV